MRVRVKGKSEKMSSREFVSATKWMCSLLLSTKMTKNIIIKINLKKQNGLKGSTEPLDCLIKPREFEVCIDPSMSRDNILCTLAHELVHVKQFAKNELGAAVQGSRQKWNGDYIDYDKLNYWDLPWEIEAYGREYGLYVRYCSYVRKEKKKKAK